MREGPPQGSPQSQPPATPAPGATPAAGQAQQPAAPAQQPRNLFQAAAQAAQTGGAAGTPTPAGRGGAGAGLATGGAGAGDAAELEALRNHPMVGQLRQLVQQNPQLLGPFLQQLGQSNPELLQLINRNQQQFLQFLAEGSGVDLGGAFGEDDDDMEGGAGGGMQNVVQVTEQERESITRMESMGFPRDIVLQAFIACDRNEELAINYLLENGELLAQDGT